MLRSCLALVLLSAPAAAAERTIGVGSFDRVRVDGGFDVRITTGRSPRATISGDAAALDLVDLRVDGTTLHVHRLSDTSRTPRGTQPVVVTLAAPTLVSASLIGGGRLAVTGMRTMRADLSVAGTGTIAVEGLAAEQANASLVGTGRITLAGRATHARLLTNGPGTIDASALAADDVTVRLDGPGETTAQARYTATVSSTGLGRVTVAGKPKCTVQPPAGGSVTCGE